MYSNCSVILKIGFKEPIKNRPISSFDKRTSSFVLTEIICSNSNDQ